jgi:DNA-binding transcriptional ArsR family regulator
VPKYRDLDATFHALADSTRRAMVERLVRGPASVSELAKPFGMALPTVLQHLAVLEAAGIVTSEKVGRVRTYQAVPGALRVAGDWIGQQRLPAERRLDRLGDLLSRPGAGDGAADAPPTSSKE